ncbi:MAG TPA: ankyrin repeat domain-containing protein [Chthoniobacterales bacterium]|jgi:ankyrin repeat protein|nr:ankyrin repeat domain-containing protein [Chthoniobacterales bacterium]
MRSSKLNWLSVGFLAGAFLITAGWLAVEHMAPKPIAPEEFLHAMETHQDSIIDRYFREHHDVNVRATNDRSLLFSAMLRDERAIAHRLIDAGASPDLADDAGVTPLMLAAMHGDLEFVCALMGHVTDITARDRAGHTALYYAVNAQKSDVVDLLLNLTPKLELAYGDTGEILALALTSPNMRIGQEILSRLPQLPEWSAGALHVLDNALRAGDRDSVRLLLSKHIPPPTPEGKRVPLLAYAIETENTPLFTGLLECGADPNTMLPAKSDEEFLDALPSKSFRNYIEDDRDVSCLMLAAGLGRTDYVRALLQAGADKSRATGRYKMMPLYFAAELGHWQAAQLLLGSGPEPEKLRIEISLASQRMSLIKDGVPVMNSVCSTGRDGFSTKRGYFVVTDKERNHRSTIYHVDMPYFMRLSCLDFGMHEGVVPNYPASHGCIRLPGDTAKRLFAEIPIGTVVAVQ